MLASAGIVNVKIFSSLKIGIVSNGDELVKIGNIKKKEQVYDSNKLQIINFLKKFNVSIKDLGILKDNEKKIENFYKKRRGHWSQ